MSIESYVRRILSARVYDVAIETPLDPAPFLSGKLSNQVLLKREDLQPVFSFKCRGAYNKLVHLSEAERLKGVVAASAGNHAQGVALAAQRLGVQAVIVMPTTTPEIKVRAVQARGVRVVLTGDNFDEAFEKSQELVAEQGFTYIHPYDDPDVIAGQGTIGMELMRQHSGPCHALFVPVGGGGLIAGVAAYVRYLRPDIRIIGVEAEDSACFAAAMEKGRRVRLKEVGLFADGVAVRQIGKETFRIARRCVDEVITTSADEICAAVKDVFDDTRSVSEPAGALAVAGLKKYVERTGIRNENLIAISSGANVNFDRLRHIAERAELGERREAIFAVTIPERPGAFRTFCRALGKRSITEFNYRYDDPKAARVFVGVQLPADGPGRTELLDTLRRKNYPVFDMTDNEMAKLHVRYMVGGHAPAAEHELIYRFEFPERPGALLQFLMGLGQNWNISMFHYRNHGAAFGRVLVGMQVPPEERSKVRKYLDALGYPYSDESENEAYKLFLG